jgi:hypothetical protein
VVSDTDSYATSQDVWDEAEENDIPIVTVDFIIDAIKNEGVADEIDEFLAKKPDSKKRKEPEADVKDEDDDMDVDTKPVTTTPAVAASAPPAAKKAKTAETPAPAAAVNKALKPPRTFPLYILLPEFGTFSFVNLTNTTVLLL